MSAVSLGDGGSEMCLCSTFFSFFFCLFFAYQPLASSRQWETRSRVLRGPAERGGIVSRETMTSGPRVFLSSQTEKRDVHLFCFASSKACFHMTPPPRHLPNTPSWRVACVSICVCTCACMRDRTCPSKQTPTPLPLVCLSHAEFL